MIPHSGHLKLQNNLLVRDVFYVPSFKHNLNSVQKLIKDTGCKVNSCDSYCMIVNSEGTRVKAVRKVVNGLYYLVNEDLAKNLSGVAGRNGTRVCAGVDKKTMNATYEISVPNTISGVPHSSNTTLWHQRLGHSPLAKLSCIEGLKGFDKNKDVCITCPLAKFTKLPYALSESRATGIFDLIHIDIWGPIE